MVKDTKYIIKRIIIGVGVALVLMLLKGNLIMNVEAKSRIRIYGSNNSLCATQENVVTNSYVTYDGSGTCSTISRISISEDNATLQNNIHYRLSSTLYLDIKQPNDYCTSSNLYTRGDFYIGNYTANQWNNSSNVTWNHIDDITQGRNGSCRYVWGLVQDWNNTISTSGYTWDFYFQQNHFPTLYGIEIRRLDLENLTSGGSTQADTINAINNQGNAIINNNNQNTQNIINNNNDNTQKILDDNVDNSSELAQHNFSNFQLETHGLTAIVTAPLRFFSSFLNSTCTPLRFPLPFVNQEVVLPCLSPIYQQYFPTFLLLYRLITDGVIGYWVCVKIFQKTKEFLDPQDDKVEVFDL